jgi:hypothetical protein
MTDNCQALYQTRAKRIADAIALRVPDRVPITASFYFFPARYYGHTFAEMMYDPDKMFDMHLKVHREFQPDLAQSPFGVISPGQLLDSIGYKQMQ